MKKGNVFFNQTFVRFFLLTLITGILSCNNKSKKTEPEKDNDSNITTNQTKGPQTANAITFKEYKLDTATIRLYETNTFKAKLFLLKVRFDDLQNPSSLKLFAYPAKNHKEFAEGVTPFELLPQGNPAFIDTKDIYVGVNEIALKYFHVDNNPKNPFLPFSYLLLTPSKNGDGNLVFKINPMIGAALVTIAGLPAETNPIPPGKPEEN